VKGGHSEEQEGESSEGSEGLARKNLIGGVLQGIPIDRKTDSNGNGCPTPPNNRKNNHWTTHPTNAKAQPGGCASKKTRGGKSRQGIKRGRGKKLRGDQKHREAKKRWPKRSAALGKKGKKEAREEGKRQGES